MRKRFKRNTKKFSNFRDATTKNELFFLFEFKHTTALLQGKSYQKNFHQNNYTESGNASES